ncbi:hypothetical protein [Psychrosphaera haliotis]|uniref:Uncharacterized protein n=1 Tax=Psychrosphaera haliotis TaxID=555083 RepID=A0A6N8F5A9_9GAMM|nr:hypothetical protein [Psychrosphaera haliotis]MUH71836.1 hypothetical protein [Psychrosphaera haliotis]
MQFSFQKAVRNKFTSISAAAIFVFSATAHSMTLDNELPDLGTSALSTLSIEKEKQLGNIILTN